MKTSILARYLILLTAGVLTIFGLGTLLRLGRNPDMAGLYAFYALLMFVDAVIFLFFYFQLDKRKKQIYRLAVIVLALNIVLTIFDQFGFIDLLYLLLNSITLIVLFMARKEFNPA